MRHTRFNLFVIGLATAAITLLPLAPLQRQAQTRFLVVLLEVALGLPCLVVLAVRKQVVTREQVAATTRGSSRAREHDEAPSPENPGPRQLAARLGLVFLGVALLAALLSDRIGLSIFGQQDSANGVILVAAFVGMWAIGVGLGRHSARLLEQCLLYAVLANACLAVAQGITGRGLIYGRAPGMLVNPVYLAPLLIGGLWIAIRRMQSNAVSWGIAIMVLAAAIQTSGSRSALLLIPVVILGAARLGPKRVAALGTLCLVAGLAVGGIAAKIGEDSSSSTARTIDSIRPDTLTSRVEVWSMATHAVRDRPLLGSGPGRFLAATGKYRTLKLVKAEGQVNQFTDAHNFLVEYAVTTGIVGLAVLVAFLAAALALSGWGSPLAGFAILALAMHLVEPQHSFVTPVVFCALGAAGTGRRALAWRGTSTAQVVLIAVACEQALLIALGSRTVYDMNGPIRQADMSASYDALSSAVWQTPFWAAPVSLQADLDATRAESGAPGAAQDAVVHRRQATERQPEWTILWAELAIAEQRAGDTDAARAHFQRALSVDPWGADIQVLYAKLLIDEGDTTEARRQLEHAVLALPDRTEADELLRGLP